MLSVCNSVNVVGLFCAVVGFIVYINTLDCGLCFDDVSAINNNADLRPDTPWSNLIWNDFWGTPMAVEGSHKSYRPLCVATFRLNFLFHGLEPFGYHLVNVLLHSAVCYCFVQFCAESIFHSNQLLQWMSGLCFAVHPIHTEAVAGIVGRAETLSAMFFLICFYCYRKSVNSTQSTGRFMWLFVSMVSCLFSVLSKEQGITVLAVCICYEYFIINQNTLQSSVTMLSQIRKGHCPKWMKQFITNVLILLSFFATIMMFRVRIMKAELPVFTVHDNPAVALPTPYRQLHWLHLIFQNAWLLLNPSRLCADWTMGTIPLIESITDPRNLSTLLTFFCLVSLGVLSIANSTSETKAVLFGLLLMVFPFIPASNLLFPVGFVIAERILYVPSMGYAILVAIGFQKLFHYSDSKLLRNFFKLCFLWIIVTHSCKTLERNRDWVSAKTLFHSAIAVNPRNGKLFNNLGHHYETLGNHTYAEELFRKATVVQPDDIGAYINLGRVLNTLNRHTDSEEAYRQAIQLMPTGKSFRVAPSHINVYFNLANLVKQQSRYEEARQLYKRAISMKPDFIEAHMNLGDLYLKMNQTNEAKNSFQNAINHRPQYSDAYFNLATTSLQMNERIEAERNYRKALNHNPNHALSLYNLGIMLSEERQSERLTEAKKLLYQLLSLQPDNDKGYFQLGIAHTELGEVAEAIAAFKKALKITPTYRQALYNLGYLLYKTGKTDQAFEVLLILKEYHPNHANGMQLLGDCYIQKDNIDEAIQLYLLCLKTNPRHITALHNLGAAMARKGQLSKAIEYFSLALEYNPDHEPSKKHLETAKTQFMKKKHKS